jgi:hypothetical protein
MRRLLIAAVCAFALTGCASFAPPPQDGLDPMDATPKVYDYSKNPFATAGEVILSVPETVVWWPYKIVSSSVRGAYDGIAGGVDRAPMPIVGVIAAPLTGAAGILNGTVKGVTRGPAYIDSTGEFGRSLGQPWKEPIPLWKDR